MKLYISEKEKSGKNIVCDDMLLTTDMATTAGSRMLEGYLSLFEATAVTKLNENGYNVYAKANVGEMALDLLGETSFFGPVTDKNGNLITATAQAVKSDEAMAGVVVEVNGANIRAAGLNGLTMVKPTYGTVSRFGVIPAACSGDTVCVTAKDAATAKEVLAAIKGHDDKDGTSLPQEKCVMIDAVPVKKAAVVKSLVNAASDEVKAVVNAAVEKLVNTGVEIVEVDGEELMLAKAAWNILMSAEVCNNVSKYDGVKYGYRSPNYSNIDELYTNSRTEAFGYLLKSTILFGSETLSEANYFKVYDKAQRIRRVICEYLTKTLADVDCLVMPCASKTAYTSDEAMANKYIAYEESLYTAPAMISGLPVVVTNGVQLMGNALAEADLLALAEKM